MCFLTAGVPVAGPIHDVELRYGILVGVSNGLLGTISGSRNWVERFPLGLFVVVEIGWSWETDKVQACDLGRLHSSCIYLAP